METIASQKRYEEAKVRRIRLYSSKFLPSSRCLRIRVELYCVTFQCDLKKWKFAVCIYRKSRAVRRTDPGP